MAAKKKVVESVKKEVVTETESDFVWRQLKDLDVEMFGLPAVKLSTKVQRVQVEPSACYLKITVGAVMPVLEELCYGKFELEEAGPYVKVLKKKETN